MMEQVKMKYKIIGSINLKGKQAMLMIGDDNKWYKTYIIGSYQEDPINNTSFRSIYGEALPLTEKEKTLIF